MKRINTLATACTAIVLSLSLISCNSKDSLTKSPPPNTKAWGVSEPIIASREGGETKYSEVNTKSKVTYSVDDRIIFGNVPPDVQLRFRMSCARGEERAQYADTFNATREFYLLEFLPQEMLYSAFGRPLVHVSCVFEMAAINSQGSRQNFPTLNLVMNDFSANQLLLLYKLRPLASDKLDIVQSSELAQVQLPAITDTETLSLRCETFSAVSTDKYVRNLSDLKIVKGDFENPDEKPQHCRVLKLRGGSVNSVSPFFLVRFFDSTGILGTNDNIVRTKGTTGFQVLTYVIFRHQPLVNTHENKSLFLRIPKLIPVEGNIRTMNSRYIWNSNLRLTVAGAKIVNEEGEKFVVEIKPLTSASLVYTLGNTTYCETGIYTMALKLTGPIPQIEALDKDYKIVLSNWNLVTEDFKNFETNQAPRPVDSHDPVLPNACHVRPI